MISRRRFFGILTTALGVFGLARTVQAETIDLCNVRVIDGHLVEFNRNGGTRYLGTFRKVV